MIPSRRAWAVMSITEKTHERQIVIGALGIELFPAPLPRVIQPGNGS
jgi:hypothetical protein